MKTLATKAIIYDNTCPMCNWYTGAFIKVGVLGKQGRISFQQADEKVMSKLDLNRARHEIPLIDTETGEVMYGLDGLTMVVGNMIPFVKPFITNSWFKKILRPLYKFISYNRRVIADSHYSGTGFDCAPDYNMGWRIALAIFGIAYTTLGIYTFGVLTKVENMFQLFCFVFAYFVLLMSVNLWKNKTFKTQLDYTAHLSVLGIIESSFFMLSALVYHYTQMPALLFAAQGAVRLFALIIHSRRVKNNAFSPWLNHAFGAGAVGLIVYLAVILK